MNKQGDRIPTNSEEKQNETETWIKKAVFKTVIRLIIWLKNVGRNILG